MSQSNNPGQDAWNKLREKYLGGGLQREKRAAGEVSESLDDSDDDDDDDDDDYSKSASFK